MEFTQTQKKILYELISGSTNAQIAAAVGYSERNVQRKMKELCKVFNVDTRNTLIREAVLAKNRGLF